MATVTRHYKSSISSINALQERCNSDEENLSAKLQSLEGAINNSGAKVTQALYEVITQGFGDLGKVTIELDTAGGSGKKGSAFILTVLTKVLFSGPLIEKETKL